MVWERKRILTLMQTTNRKIGRLHPMYGKVPINRPWGKMLKIFTRMAQQKYGTMEYEKERGRMVTDRSIYLNIESQ